MTIHITVQGRGHPLVLFHGWGFDAQVWEPILPALTQQHQLFLVDLPGFGATPFMSWEEFISALLKQLPTHFALLGWSMGGLWATRLTLEAPERVTHLINVSSSPRFVREEHWPGVDGQMLKQFYNDLILDPHQTLENFVKLQAKQAKTETLGKSSTMHGLQAGLDVLLHWDLRQALLQLNKPTFYLFGRLDTIIPHQTMSAMKLIYPDFHYLMLAKAAHVPFLSHPEPFIEAVEAFLK